MVFGVSTACFFPRLLNEDAITVLAKLGVKNTEVFFSCLHEYNINYIKELEALAKGSGIKICSVHAYSIQFEPQLFSSHSRSKKEAFNIYHQVLKAGSRLGASVYVFHGPVHLKKASPLKLDFKRIAATANVLSRMAGDYGIKLAWENVHYCWYDNPSFPQKLAPYLQTDNLYYTLDLKQAAQSGFAPYCYIEPAAGRIANVHLCDYLQDGANIVPKMPFEGNADFAAIKKALFKTHYNGTVILEVYSNNFTHPNELSNNLELIKTFFSS